MPRRDCPVAVPSRAMARKADDQHQPACRFGHHPANIGFAPEAEEQQPVYELRRLIAVHHELVAKPRRRAAA
jgi:hypothetical protein